MNGLKPGTRILAILAITAFVAAAIICNVKGDEWEQLVRSSLYTIKQDSIPDYAKETTDERGVPFVYYPEQNGITAGKQYNATIVTNYALNYYKLYKSTGDTTARAKFFHCILWLDKNMSRHGNYALYEFNWRQPWYVSVGVPFTSGMTSGRAMEAFISAYDLNPSAHYISNAKLLLNGFYLPIDSGGFTYKSPTGWWYEELADTAKQSPFILDGHIFAVLGVYKYWQLTKSDSAAFVFRQGISALKEKLPSYNAPGYWSYYDKYKKLSDKKYHRILTGQMKRLWQITNDDFFKTHYQQWNKPLAKPYVLRVIAERNVSGILLIIVVATAVLLLSLLAMYLFRAIIRGR
jgi:hypothetical protein